MKLLSAVLIILSLQAQAYEGHSLATHDVYVPQRNNFGMAIGSSWSTSSYVLVEAFGGTEILRCGFHCFSYADFAARLAAQNGETNYQGSLGWRFQKYFDDSSWGPYLRPFVGLDHYIFSGQVKDTGFMGAAIGSYYFLHPGADLRIELGQAFGPQAWTFLSIGLEFKFRNI